MPLSTLMRIALLSLAASPLAAGQGWLDKYPQLGLCLPRVDGFEALPTQPDERFVALYFLEQAGETPATRARPACFLAIVPHAAARAGDPTGADAYLEQSLAGWTREAQRGTRERFGYSSRGVQLASADAGRVGYAHIWQGEERDVLLIGVCAREDGPRLLSWYRSLGERMKFIEVQGDEGERRRLERFYKQQRYGDSEGRIAVRLAAVEGWEVRDSEHYIVVDHSGDEVLLERVTRELEYLRAELQRRYAPSRLGRRAADEVACLRVCRDREEYLAYGGFQGSAGYWNPNVGELVIYDPRPSGGTQEDLWITLHHEASHQYIHAATGGVVPHSWFDEGLADWFAGATFDGARMREVGTNPWRLKTAQSVLRSGEPVRLAELLVMPQPAFYASAGRNYALAWSLLAFLESAEARARPDFARFLPTYYQSLQEGIERELKAAGGSLSGAALQRAGEAVREFALARALERLELATLEQAWKTAVLALPE